MTGKELKKLNRYQLLEILLDLSKENEKLSKENELLRSQLEDKNLEIKNCGSLAEAALQLNGVFQAAEAACAQYTENIQSRSAKLEEYCQRMEQETADRCRRMEQQTKEACDVLLAQARTKAQSFMDDAMKQRESQNQEYLWLTEIMNSGETE